VSVACVLLPAFQRVFDGPARSKTSNVVRWFNTIVNQPNVKVVIGDVQLFEGGKAKH
jgi:elongation factor 1-gamma